MKSGMKLIGKVRELLGIETNYKLSKLLNSHGIEITPNGVQQYEVSAKGMRLEVLCVLRKLCGLSWEQFGKELDAEFLPKKK
jgi:hypothetical protein